MKHHTFIKQTSKHIIIFAIAFITGFGVKDFLFTYNQKPTQTTITHTNNAISNTKISYTVCFTPHQACLPLIINEINHAKRSIHVQAYSLTSNPIAAALLRAKTRGVSVTIIADKSQQRERYTQIRALKAHGISVFIDHKPAIAHNKVILIDGATVISGSYNFSASAEHRNAENVLVIKNKELEALYQANFQRRLRVSAPFTDVSSKKARVTGRR